ncbi:MAG: hypothetical protein FVQ80_11525 [Planctomycetes bacterium]|nr:hypothetical protein [Planctomycetota bacterium]
MKGINIGCDFSMPHVEAIQRLVEYGDVNGCDVKITGVYGSPRHANPFGSVRPMKREVFTLWEDVVRNIERLRGAGLEINLAMNSLLPHLKGAQDTSKITANILDCKVVKDEFISFVEKCLPHIDNLIIAHPYLMDLLHEHFYGDQIGIIASTIMNIHTIPQLHWIKSNWVKVNKVCPALWKNRNIDWLTEANSIMPLELLVNEFCSIGGVECEGLYRQACYMSQSLEIKHWNPMLTCCIAERAKKPWSWMMARVILPQWLEYYHETAGIQHFKLTGRTHDAEYLEEVGRYYLEEEFHGNVPALWGQLEAVLNRIAWSEEQKKAAARVNIPADLFDDMFHKYALMRCDPDVCGVVCKSCENYYKEVILKKVQDAE